MLAGDLERAEAAVAPAIAAGFVAVAHAVGIDVVGDRFGVALQRSASALGTLTLACGSTA
jgi:hypothetical protein